MEALSKHSTLSYIPSPCPILSQPVYLPDRADVHLNTCVIAIGWTVREPLAECQALSPLSVTMAQRDAHH